MDKTVNKEGKKLVQRTIFLDRFFQKKLITDLLFRGYNVMHESNGFVRLYKEIPLK